MEKSLFIGLIVKTYKPSAYKLWTSFTFFFTEWHWALTKNHEGAICIRKFKYFLYYLQINSVSITMLFSHVILITALNMSPSVYKIIIVNGVWHFSYCLLSLNFFNCSMVFKSSKICRQMRRYKIFQGNTLFLALLFYITNHINKLPFIT